MFSWRNICIFRIQSVNSERRSECCIHGNDCALTIYFENNVILRQKNCFPVNSWVVKDEKQAFQLVSWASEAKNKMRELAVPSGTGRIRTEKKTSKSCIVMCTRKCVCFSSARDSKERGQREAIARISARSWNRWHM